MHPLIDNLSTLRDTELDEKINALTRRYFMTNNPGVQQQIASVLEMYREEQTNRRLNELKRTMKQRGKDLDSLIDIS